MVKKTDFVLIFIYALVVYFFMNKILLLPLIVAYVLLNPAYLIIIAGLTKLHQNKVKGFIASLLVIAALDLLSAPRIVTPITPDKATPEVQLNMAYMTIQSLPFSFKINMFIVYVAIPILLAFAAYKLSEE